MRLSAPFNQRQKQRYIETVIDQKYTLCTAANSNFNISIDLLIILRMNYREYGGPHGLKLFMKDVTVHYSTSVFVNSRKVRLPFLCASTNPRGKTPGAPFGTVTCKQITWLRHTRQSTLTESIKSLNQRGYFLGGVYREYLKRNQQHKIWLTQYRPKHTF